MGDGSSDITRGRYLPLDAGTLHRANVELAERNGALKRQLDEATADLKQAHSAIAVRDEALRTALGFYANVSNYADGWDDDDNPALSPVGFDCGERARQALGVGEKE